MEDIKGFFKDFFFIQTLFYVKGTLMQIWKSPHVFVFICKLYVEDFTLKHFLLFEICAPEVWKKFVYKHSQAIECVKNKPTFLRNLQTSRANKLRILRIKNANFSRYCFYMNTNI